MSKLNKASSEWRKIKSEGQTVISPDSLDCPGCQGRPDYLDVLDQLISAVNAISLKGEAGEKLGQG